MVIEDEGYLEIYRGENGKPYEAWKAKVLPDYEEGEFIEFSNNDVIIKESSTKPMQPLSEPDLISKMDTHGIGTDATQAGHITKIQERGYISYTETKRFVPTPLGEALVDAYNISNLPLAKPDMRKNLEIELGLIEKGQRTRDEVVIDQIEKYRDAHKTTFKNLHNFEALFAKHFDLIQLPDCDCGKPAIILSVKKDSPNQGRPFFSCEDRECDFFQWADEEVDENAPQCRCEKTATKFTVTKDGPNNGRKFFSCSKCDFFQWEDEDEIVNENTPNCGCQIPAQELTVKKDGPNKGRQFFSCKTRTCDFFQWGDEEPEIKPVPKEGAPQCRCNIPATEFTVKKDGPNKGRPFFSCSERKCDFFQWGDEEPETQNVTVENAPNCACQLPAQQFTVKKDGPNKGRPFFSCQTRKCDFFQWGDEETESNQVPKEGTPQCGCNIPAKEFTVKKAGPNHGRSFFSCTNRKCGFFEWADDQNNNMPEALKN